MFIRPLGGGAAAAIPAFLGIAFCIFSIGGYALGRWGRPPLMAFGVAIHSFYLPWQMTTFSRFLQYMGLSCLAFSCRPQPLHAAAASLHCEADLAAIPDVPVPPPGFYAGAAFVLANRWLCVSISQDKVAVWSLGHGGWSVHSLHLPVHPYTIWVSPAYTSARELAGMSEADAIEAALEASQLFIVKCAGNCRMPIEYHSVYHVRKRQHFFPGHWWCERVGAASVWLEGDQPRLFLHRFTEVVPSDVPFRVYRNLRERGQDWTGYKWLRKGSGNLVLTDNPHGGGKGQNFCAYRLKPGDAGIDKECIAILPGRPEAEQALISRDPAVPQHMRGVILTAARTVAGGAECLLVLALVGDTELEGHLYIRPEGCPDRPHQIIRLARGRFYQFAAGAFLFHLGPYGLFYGVGTQDSRTEKLSLFFYPFLPGKRGLDLLAAGFIRQQCGAELSIDLQRLLVKFCSPLPPTGLGKGVLLNPSPEQLRMLLAR